MRCRNEGPRRGATRQGREHQRFGVPMQVQGISHGLVEAIAVNGRAAEPASWLERPCLGTPEALWFGPADDAPAESLSERRARTAVAKAVCAECPFTAFCLSSELARPMADQWGIRGGLTAVERKAEIRFRRAARLAVTA